MICKLYAFYLNCMVLSVHLHVLCNLPAVIVYVCQLLNQSMLATAIVRSSICHGCSWRIDQILLNLQIVYRFLSEFTALTTGNVHALLTVDHSLHLHVGLTLTSMKTQTVLPLLTVHYCMKAICEKCFNFVLYYPRKSQLNMAYQQKVFYMKESKNIFKSYISQLYC